MKRTLTTVPLGENHIRVTAKLEGSTCLAASQEALQHLMYMFTNILNQPDLLQTGAICPNSISISHNGSRWVVEVESIIDRDRNGQAPIPT